MYRFSGVIFSKGKGKVWIIDLNLFNSPYFSFIGNLGNSRKFLLGSITPECCPKANLKFNSVTIFFKTLLYSPKGYENNLGE